jgi:hypothetical protein
LDIQSTAKTVEKHTPPESQSTSAQTGEPLACDCWEFDDQLWHIAQALQVDKNRDSRREKVVRRKMSRLDPAHEKKVSGTICGRRSVGFSNNKVPDTFFSAIIWMALSLGTAALVCGGTLLIWSVTAERNELWNLGLPIAAGGQIALLIGLVLQLDRFWRANHQTATKLDEVDEQLNDLRTTTALLGTAHGPSYTAFYTHLAGGANPQLLLNDLKGQLDMLAMKIGEQE